MAVQYDPQIITQHAETLYRRASGIVFTYGVLGFLVGAGILGALAAQHLGNSVTVLVGGLVSMFMGVSIGRSRAFVYQLQAQQALCQVAIELNTRRTAASSPVSD